MDGQAVSASQCEPQVIAPGTLDEQLLAGQAFFRESLALQLSGAGLLYGEVSMTFEKVPILRQHVQAGFWCMCLS